MTPGGRSAGDSSPPGTGFQGYSSGDPPRRARPGPGVEGGKRSHRRRARVPLDEQKVGRLRRKRPLEREEAARRERRKALAAPHDVEPKVDPNPEEAHHLVADVLVLTERKNTQVDAGVLSAARATGASLMASGRVPSEAITRRRIAGGITTDEASVAASASARGGSGL